MNAIYIMVVMAAIVGVGVAIWSFVDTWRAAGSVGGSTEEAVD